MESKIQIKYKVKDFEHLKELLGKLLKPNEKYDYRGIWNDVDSPIKEIEKHLKDDLLNTNGYYHSVFNTQNTDESNVKFKHLTLNIGVIGSLVITDVVLDYNVHYEKDDQYYDKTSHYTITHTTRQIIINGWDDYRPKDEFIIDVLDPKDEDKYNSVRLVGLEHIFYGA